MMDFPEKVTYAQRFETLMRARWGEIPAEPVSAAWHLEPGELQYLSRSAVRVAASIGVRCSQDLNLVRLDFPDRSMLLTNCLGSRFYA
jgi:hypothetical protein